MKYTLYYRNYMKSCNYRCSYCPFPKAKIHKEKIEKDKQYFYKFINFIKNSDKKVDVFLAPRGELLTFDYYREAIAELSHFHNVGEIVVQTNLSSDLKWIEKANVNKLILWTTYHPEQVESVDFFKQVNHLVRYDIRFTVGTVGVKENFKKIEKMKRLLDGLGKSKPYLWINAYKAKRKYYKNDEILFLEEMDPLFEINLKNYKSMNADCKTGYNTFFVEYDGNVHRCWQEKVKLGNIYMNKLDSMSLKSKCNKKICGCYIGYSNLENLKLESVYKNSLLGRVYEYENHSGLSYPYNT